MGRKACLTVDMYMQLVLYTRARRLTLFMVSFYRFLFYRFLRVRTTNIVYTEFYTGLNIRCSVWGWWMYEKAST